MTYSKLVKQKCLQRIECAQQNNKIMTPKKPARAKPKSPNFQSTTVRNLWTPDILCYMYNNVSNIPHTELCIS